MEEISAKRWCAKQGSERDEEQKRNSENISRFKRHRLSGSPVIYLSRIEYNSDNGSADELLKQTNAAAASNYWHGTVFWYFFFSTDAQELTRLRSLCVSVASGIRRTIHQH